MSRNDLHPSVQRFKDFVNDHPKVKEQLRKNHHLIQKYYEKWMILGEEDPYWKQLPDIKKGNQTNKKEWIKQLGTLMEEINWEDVSRQIDELNGAIGHFQQLISDVRKDTNKKSQEVEYPYF